MSIIPDRFYRVSVKALVLDAEGSFLLVQERGGRWSLPGGALEFNEEVEACLRREVKLHTGQKVQVIEKSPISAEVSFAERKQCHILALLFRTTLSPGEFKPEDESVVAAKYYKREEVSDLDIDEEDKKLVEFISTQ